MTVGRQPRLEGLDTLRGLAVAAMIVVNNPGNWNAVYAQLTHSHWNGVTFADLIFPAFIFIMGVSVALSSAAVRTSSSSGVDRRTIQRTVTLIALGLALNVVKAWPHLDTVRIPGVLPRIAVTYLVTSAVLSIVRGRQRPLWLVTVGLLTVHWLLLAGTPWSPGSLLPGTNNAAAVDRWLFGTHLLAPTGDPEGALGVLTSVGTALIGASIGLWLKDPRGADGAMPADSRRAFVRLAAFGAALMTIGYLWSFLLPFNKFLWTGSFAVFTSGAATLGLTMFMPQRLTDAAPLRPFRWLGTNALAIYFLSELIASLFDRPWLMLDAHAVAPKELLFWSGLAPRIGDHGGVWSSVVYALLYTACWMGVSALMRWRGIRIRA